jgi:alpha-glucan, water dikinase
LSQLRSKLTKKPEKDEVLIEEYKATSSEVPKELVQVQAYIRWEKAGKPNYPPEKQTVAFSTIRQFFNIQY